VSCGLLALWLATGVVLSQEKPPSEEDSRLNVTRAALEDGLFELAQSQMESYLQDTAGKAVEPEAAVVLLMRALRGQGEYGQIEALLTAKTRWGRKAVVTAATEYWRALACYEQGRIDDVLSALKDFETRFPNSAYGSREMRLRAWCMLKANKGDEARRLFSRFQERHSSDPEAGQNLLDWAKSLIAAGKAKEALPLLEQLTSAGKSGPAVPEGRFWLGEVLRQEGRLADARRVLNVVASDAEAGGDLRARVWLGIAAVFEAETNLTEAVTAVAQAGELAVSKDLKLRSQSELGRLLLEVGRLEEGIPLVKAFVSAQPGAGVASALHLRLAGTLLNHGRYGEAVAEYQHHLECFTNAVSQAEACYGKGWALTRLERYAEASAAFEKAHTLFEPGSKKERALFRKGDAHYRNGQFKLAAATYAALLELYPESPLVASARFQLAVCRKAAGDVRGAEQSWREVLTMYPRTQQAEESYLKLAEVRSASNQWHEAVALLSTMLNSYSNGVYYADGLHMRGLVQCRIYRFSEALRDFATVTERFCDSGVAEHAEFMKGMCHYWLNRDDEALKICDTFMERFPESPWAPDALFWTGEYYYNRQKFESAETRFVRFVEKYPTHRLADAALLFSGRSALRRKEFLGAIELLARLVTDYPKSTRTAEAWFAQAEAKCELGVYAEAIVILEKLISGYPDSELIPAAWGRRGDCHFMLGTTTPDRYEEAIRCYQVITKIENAPADLVFQAEYKVGRCMFKLGRTDEALEQYYSKVMIRFLEERKANIWHSEAAVMWFTRASRDAVDILVAREEWRRAARVLARVIETDVPGVEEFKARLEKLRSERWWVY